MTDITLPRAVVEQALEALENAEDQLAKPYSTDASKAIPALRAALAQQAEPVQEPITDYWYQHYVVDGLCGLCGNRGVIDTRGTTTPAGVAVGGLHYCICPNGQTMRRNKAAPSSAR